MDCFTDFYERLEKITTPEDAENEDNTGFLIDNISSDLSSGVSEEYFDLIDHASGMLLNFYEKYIADTHMHVALHERINTRRRKNYDDLKLILMVDVIRAYEGLDHNTRLNSPEGIALLLLLVKLFRPDYFISFSGLQAIPMDIINIDGLIPYIAACSEEIDVPKEESIISSLLKDIKPKADRTYRMCLYRLFEAVSQVDGIISQSEKEYLMALLNLDDDDVSNDINIESIFNQAE